MKLEDEEVFFNNVVSFRVLPKSPVDKFQLTDTTPSVKNCENWICQNVAGVVVTNFDDGAVGQKINILGDGFTTISNNAFIKTNTGANKLLAVNKIYRFHNFNNIWVEDA
jgi:hypothetical protein